MPRRLSIALIMLSIAPAVAATAVDNQQCMRELASVDRSFAEAMRDLQRNSASDMRCTAWRRQIDVLQKASDVFVRCEADAARESNVKRMNGSIADFRDQLSQARCP